MTKCKYCGTHAHYPCSTESLANSCGYKPKGVYYHDVKEPNPQPLSREGYNMAGEIISNKHHISVLEARIAALESVIYEECSPFNCSKDDNRKGIEEVATRLAPTRNAFLVYVDNGAKFPDPIPDYQYAVIGPIKKSYSNLCLNRELISAVRNHNARKGK